LARAKCCRPKSLPIEERLAHHPNSRMYRPAAGPAAAGPAIAVEEYIGGTEYSCDVMAENGRARLLRLARKIPCPRSTFGTTLGYVLPARLPRGLTLAALERVLARSAYGGRVRQFRDGGLALLARAPPEHQG